MFLAEDPELGRRVAIKLVATGDQGSSSSATLRLQREAQAMAKVTHPNLVHVYDVGTMGDRVWIAMEYVPGVTLKAWLKENADAPWQDVLERFIDAGRGVAAAHRAGLVHRDFKPDNVICGEDGLVRVLDFGLARDLGASGSSRGGAIERVEELGMPADASVRASVKSASGTPAPDRASTATDLTQTGALLGTPAYMSPEQHRGERTDARTDIFSFCVSLYEALSGKRPFEGRTYAELLGQVFSEQPLSPPMTRAPAHVVSAIMRGLARDRSERWDTMDELLAALGRETSAVATSRGGSAAVYAAAAVGVGALAALIYALNREPPAPPEAAGGSASQVNASDTNGVDGGRTEPLSADTRKKLALILVAPNPRERLNRAEQYIEEVGEAGGKSRLALAEASAAAVLWEDSCPRARMGLCIDVAEDPNESAGRDAEETSYSSTATKDSSRSEEKENASDFSGANARCVIASWPEITVRERAAEADRARELAASAIAHAQEGVPADADAIEVEAWPTVISLAHAILADTQMEAYLELRPPDELRGDPMTKRKVAPMPIADSAAILTAYMTEKRASFEALAPMYQEIVDRFPGFSEVVALSRLGIGRQHLVDEVARLPIPSFPEPGLRDAYCELLRDSVRPAADAAVKEFRACSHEAMVARLSSEYVDMCDEQILRIEAVNTARARKVVRAHISEVRDCYSQGLARDAALSGIVKTRFSIAADGHVEAVMTDAANPFPDPQVEDCIAKAILGWSFPPNPGGESTIIIYPFKLSPG